jgi:hypothetical protein
METMLKKEEEEERKEEREREKEKCLCHHTRVQISFPLLQTV